MLSRTIKNSSMKRVDILLLIFTYAIAFFGVLIIYSATRGDNDPQHKKQLIWIAVGTVGLIIGAVANYHSYARFTTQLYVLNLLPLFFIVLRNIVSHKHGINGADRWIKFGPILYQPSEFAKVIIILTLAAFLTKYHNQIKRPKILFLSFLFVLLPMLLIMKQPDLGTGLVVLAIWFGMVFIAGAKVKHLGIMILTGLTLFTIMWFTGFGLKGYQRARMMTFLNPGSDVKKTGYQVEQAKIAIGSGGLFGKGLFHSMQVRSGHIPEKQTDFIFTDIGEELGFVGCVLVLALYGMLFYRGIKIIASADEDIYGKLIATGIVSMFAYHIIENIGMNIGVMPVAGVPLLLISYGGSSMLVTLFCIGLLESICIHRHELRF